MFNKFPTAAFVWLVAFAPVSLTAAQTAKTASPSEQAALKEFEALDPATQEAALAAVRKKPKTLPKQTKKEPPSSFVPLDTSKLPTFGKPSPATKAVEEPTINSWLEHNVEIRNSFYDSKQVDSPAKMSWNKNNNQDAFYAIDAAIVGTMFFKHPRSFSLFNQDVYVAAYPLFEAHISNAANTTTTRNAQDSLLYALPLTFTYGTQLSDTEFTDWTKSRTVNDPGSQYRSSDWVEGGEFILNPAYRTDQENNVRAFEGGLYWKPGVWIPVGLNVRRRIIQNVLTFRWDPMVGFEVGDYQKEDGLSSSLPKDYARAFFRVFVEVGIGPEDQPPFTLTASYTLRHEFTSSGMDDNYSEISAIYNIDPDRRAPVADAQNLPATDPKTGKPIFVNIPGHVKIGATWKCGKDVPTFKNVNTFTTWIGLQF